MWSSKHSIVVFALAAGASTGCTDSSTETKRDAGAAGRPGDASSRDTGVGMDATGGAAPEDARATRDVREAASGEAGPCAADLAPGVVCIESVTGRFVDEDGDPAEADLLVSACGPEQCSPGNTDASGRFDVPVNLPIVPSDYSVLVHARPDYAAFYFILPEASGPNVDLGDLPFLSMPDDGPLIAVDRMGTPAQSLTSGEVTLEIPDDTFVRVDVESATFGDEGRRFRARRVSGELMDKMIDPKLGASVLYGFEPFEARFEVPEERTPKNVRLSFDNTLELAAGTRVEILALGSYVYPDWVSPARFEPVANAAVTPDGARIEFDPDQGLPYLTWVALREAE